MTNAGPVDVAIIGAGPAGLTAAYLLSKEGFRVAVIERDPHLVGGISRTVEYKGYRFDIGGHRFFSKAREVVALWNELLPNDFIDRPRMSRIFYEGKYYSYPLRAFEALREPLTASGASFAAVPAVASPSDKSVWGALRPARPPQGGDCQCPYDLMLSGQQCGERSAYAKGRAGAECYF